jgi:hypothetical protein
MVTGSKSGDLHLGRRTFLATFIQVMQAWTGVTSVVVYAPTLFRTAGFSDHKSELLTGCQNLVTMVSCALAIFTVDRFGRRPALLVGGVAQSICWFLLGALSKIAADRNNPNYGAAAGSFIFIYDFVFATTWLSVPWVYPTEIFPLSIRAKGNAFGLVGEFTQRHISSHEADFHRLESRLRFSLPGITRDVRRTRALGLIHPRRLQSLRGGIRLLLLSGDCMPNPGRNRPLICFQISIRLGHREALPGAAARACRPRVSTRWRVGIEEGGN